MSFKPEDVIPESMRCALPKSVRFRAGLPRIIPAKIHSTYCFVKHYLFAVHSQQALGVSGSLYDVFRYRAARVAVYDIFDVPQSRSIRYTVIKKAGATLFAKARCSLVQISPLLVYSISRVA